MPRLIRSACLTGYVEVALSFGLDPFRLLKEAGLDQSCLLDPDTKISIDKCHWLLEVLASEARVEDFGLRISENRRLSNLGPLALATRDASSLREVLDAVIRYMRLHTDVFVVSLEEIDELAIVKAELIGSRTRLHAR
jgi:hypothetical protein